MFLVLPMLSVFWIYLFAAVLPALFLLHYIYREDSVEKEPAPLLWSLLLAGVLAALISIVLEELIDSYLVSALGNSSAKYKIVSAFLGVAAVEEGMKFLLLKHRTWRNPNFNYRFDGVVYAVFVSLGFATFENVGYVFGYGLSVSVPRAFLAVPGHMAFAVFMGAFYGRAKLCADLGDRGGEMRNLIAAYLTAVFLHGFYDACAMIGTGLSTTIFVLFVVLMYIIVLKKIRRESQTDEPV